MDKNENIMKNIIYQNSTIRTVLIEKVEYIMLFKHPKILEENCDINKMEFGKLLLITKYTQSDKKYYQYESNQQCINY